MKSIAKYQVIEELGGSATGKSFRVRDAFRNREFAVKILQTVPGLSADAKQQFCGHLTSCAELTHRQIAKVHDIGEVEEGIFVATEWRSGMDLRRFMQENRDLPLGEKLAVIAQVAEGLAFAHSRGIAHGNLKPSNIFVDAARDVSILDFGIAKWLAALLDAGCRPEGLVAKYLAPEQVLGQPCDARSDIFALGLMLYEFTAGKYPFSADPGLVPREIVHSEPEPLCKLDVQVPKELEQLVARALNKTPEQRLQTAEELASGLYLAAQQFRRVASAAQAADPPSVEQMIVEPSHLLPPALTPEPVFSQPALQPALQPAPATVLEPPAMQAAVPAPPPVRERPQDVELESQPWTARSYAASTTALSPVAGTDSPKRPASPAPTYHPREPSAPEFQPPQSFLKPANPLPDPVQPKIGKKTSKMKKRVLVTAVGLILAASIVSSLVSRQNLKASQNKSHAVTAVKEPIAEPDAPAVKPQTPPAATVRETRAPKPGESGPDDLGNPEFSAKQTLNGPVRTLWESGRYAPALALVNQVLANDPTNEDARSWKKKIREAQAAEAALK
jgi:serine/threonine protein kinase